MRNQQLDAWEGELNHLLRRVDQALEERFAQTFGRHPARLPHGHAANPQHDGLFRITASFTAGYGSQHGRGYVLQIELMTLEEIPAKQIKLIEKEAVRMIREGLDEAMPGRQLRVVRDGRVWKIIGDLSLSRQRP